MLVDLLLPVRCAACGAPAPRGWCERCAAEALRLVLPDRGHLTLGDGIDAVGLLAYDGVARRTLHGLKAGGRHAAAGPLGLLLRRALLAGLDPGSRVLTWVPATSRRRRARGMDVPRLLAGPAAVRLLVRTAERPDQTLLTAVARRSSPRGSFAAVGPLRRPVTLVDDVRTSGGTALAAATTLRAAGAPSVLVVTLAVGGEDARRSVPRRHEAADPT